MIPFWNHNPSTMMKRKIAIGLTVVLSAAIFVLALIPIPPPQAIPGTDKFHHMIAFGALTTPCAVLYPRALLWVLPAIVFQMGLIEILQPLVNRHREWADFVAGMKGLALALGLAAILHCAGMAARRQASRRG